MARTHSTDLPSKVAAPDLYPREVMDGVLDRLAETQTIVEAESAEQEDAPVSCVWNGTSYVTRSTGEHPDTVAAGRVRVFTGPVDPSSIAIIMRDDDMWAPI